MTAIAEELDAFENVRSLRAAAINTGVLATELYLRGIGLPVEQNPVYQEAANAWTVAQKNLAQAVLQNFEVRE